MKETSIPTQGSTSLGQTEDSARYDSVIALGRRIVEDLELGRSVDTLGCWMAHYIAELIAGAESAQGEEKILAERNCFEAILLLWKHHVELPNGNRPFQELEPIIRAIESLDPEGDAHRYYRLARMPKAEDERESKADSWLEMAIALDNSAKVLIGFCLAEAAASAVDKSQEWVKLAEAAGAEEGAPEMVFRFVSDNAGIGKHLEPNADTRLLVQDRIKRLDSFTRFAKAVAQDLRAHLKALPSSKSNPKAKR